MDIQLTDIPGPNGIPLASTPWTFFQEAAQMSEAGSGFALLAEGVTGTDGRIVLTAAQLTQIQTAYCANPSDVWLSTPGETTRLQVAWESKAWTDDEALFHLLQAAGFFVDETAYSRRVFATWAGAAELALAQTAYGADDKKTLLERLRSERMGESHP